MKKIRLSLKVNKEDLKKKLGIVETIPETGDAIIEKINASDGQIDSVRVKDLDEKFKKIDNQISSVARGRSGRAGGMEIYDLSSQANGILKVFTVPKSRAGQHIISSDFPTVLLKGNGFTLNNTTTQITLASSLNAPSSGSQLLYIYSSVFNV